MSQEWKKVRAKDLKPGDVVIKTNEKIVRTFKDKMTDAGRIEVLFEKMQQREGDVTLIPYGTRAYMDDKRMKSYDENRYIPIVRKKD